MFVSWEAFYDDDTSFIGDYDRIDRRKLKRFEVMFGDKSRMGTFRLNVPKGERLVYRKRSAAGGSGRKVEMVLVACERSDRSCSTLAELYFDEVLKRPRVKFHERWTEMSESAPGMVLWPPQLMDGE